MGQKIQESSCGKNETVDIDILIASKNDERKNHASYQNNKQTSLAYKGVETIDAQKETVGIDILKTSKNGERKNHAIYQNNKSTSLENKDVEPVEKFK